MNCKLYQKECKQTGTRKSRPSTTQRTDDSFDATESIVVNQNLVSNTSTSTENHSYFIGAHDATPSVEGHGDATDHHRLANLDSLSCKFPALHGLRSVH